MEEENILQSEIVENTPVSHEQEEAVHLKEELMMSHMPNPGLLRTHDFAEPWLRFTPQEKKVKVSPQVLEMLMNTSRELHTAHAEFEYRKEVKRKSLEQDVDDETLTAMIAEEVYLGIPCPEEALQALKKDLEEVQAELLAAEVKAVEREQMKSAKQQQQQQQLLGSSPRSPGGVISRVRGRRRKPRLAVPQIIRGLATSTQWGRMSLMELLVPARDIEEQHEVQTNIKRHPVLRILSGHKRASAAVSHLRDSEEEAAAAAEEAAKAEAAAAAAAAEAAAIAAALETAKTDDQAPAALEVLADALTRKSGSVTTKQRGDDDDDQKESWVVIVKRRKKEETYRKMLRGLKTRLEENARVLAATKIQRAWRDFKDRRTHAAALAIDLRHAAREMAALHERVRQQEEEEEEALKEEAKKATRMQKSSITAENLADAQAGWEDASPWLRDDPNLGMSIREGDMSVASTSAVLGSSRARTPPGINAANSRGSFSGASSSQHSRPVTPLSDPKEVTGIEEVSSRPSSTSFGVSTRDDASEGIGIEGDEVSDQPPDKDVAAAAAADNQLPREEEESGSSGTKAGAKQKLGGKKKASYTAAAGNKRAKGLFKGAAAAAAAASLASRTSSKGNRSTKSGSALKAESQDGNTTSSSLGATSSAGLKSGHAKMKATARKSGELEGVGERSQLPPSHMDGRSYNVETKLGAGRGGRWGAPSKPLSSHSSVSSTPGPGEYESSLDGSTMLNKRSSPGGGSGRGSGRRERSPLSSQQADEGIRLPEEMTPLSKEATSSSKLLLRRNSSRLNTVERGTPHSKAVKGPSASLMGAPRQHSRPAAASDDGSSELDAALQRLGSVSSSSLVRMQSLRQDMQAMIESSASMKRSNNSFLGEVSSLLDSEKGGAAEGELEGSVASGLEVLHEEEEEGLEDYSNNEDGGKPSLMSHGRSSMDYPPPSGSTLSLHSRSSVSPGTVTNTPLDSRSGSRPHSQQFQGGIGVAGSPRGRSGTSSPTLGAKRGLSTVTVGGQLLDSFNYEEYMMLARRGAAAAAAAASAKSPLSPGGTTARSPGGSRGSYHRTSNNNLEGMWPSSPSGRHNNQGHRGRDDIWPASGSMADLDLATRSKEGMLPTAPSGFVYVPQGRNQGDLHGLMVHGEGGSRYGAMHPQHGEGVSRYGGAMHPQHGEGGSRYGGAMHPQHGEGVSRYGDAMHPQHGEGGSRYGGAMHPQHYGEGGSRYGGAMHPQHGEGVSRYGGAMHPQQNLVAAAAGFEGANSRVLKQGNQLDELQQQQRPAVMLTRRRLRELITQQQLPPAAAAASAVAASGGIGAAAAAAGQERKQKQQGSNKQGLKSLPMQGQDTVPAAEDEEVEVSQDQLALILKEMLARFPPPPRPQQYPSQDSYMHAVQQHQQYQMQYQQLLSQYQTPVERAASLQRLSAPLVAPPYQQQQQQQQQQQKLQRPSPAAAAPSRHSLVSAGSSSSNHAASPLQPSLQPEPLLSEFQSWFDTPMQVVGFGDHTGRPIHNLVSNDQQDGRHASSVSNDQQDGRHASSVSSRNHQSHPPTSHSTLNLNGGQSHPSDMRLSNGEGFQQLSSAAEEQQQQQQSSAEEQQPIVSTRSESSGGPLLVVGLQGHHHMKNLHVRPASSRPDLKKEVCDVGGGDLDSEDNYMQQPQQQQQVRFGDLGSGAVTKQDSESKPAANAQQLTAASNAQQLTAASNGQGLLTVVGQGGFMMGMQSPDNGEEKQQQENVAAAASISRPTTAVIGALQRELELREQQQQQQQQWEQEGKGDQGTTSTKKSFTYKDYMLSESSMGLVAETRSKLLKFSSLATNHHASLTAASIAAVEELLFDEDGDPVFKSLHQKEVLDRLHYAAELYLQQHPEKVRDKMKAAKALPKRKRSIWYKFAIQVADHRSLASRKVLIHRMHRRRKAAEYPDAWGRTDTPPAADTCGMADAEMSGLHRSYDVARAAGRASTAAAAAASPPVALPLRYYMEQLKSLLQRPLSSRSKRSISELLEAAKLLFEARAQISHLKDDLNRRQSQMGKPTSSILQQVSTSAGIKTNVSAETAALRNHDLDGGHKSTFAGMPLLRGLEIGAARLYEEELARKEAEEDRAMATVYSTTGSPSRRKDRIRTIASSLFETHHSSSHQSRDLNKGHSEVLMASLASRDERSHSLPPLPSERSHFHSPQLSEQSHLHTMLPAYLSTPYIPPWTSRGIHPCVTPEQESRQWFGSRQQQRRPWRTGRVPGGGGKSIASSWSCLAAEQSSSAHYYSGGAVTPQSAVILDQNMDGLNTTCRGLRWGAKAPSLPSRPHSVVSAPMGILPPPRNDTLLSYMVSHHAKPEEPGLAYNLSHSLLCFSPSPNASHDKQHNQRPSARQLPTSSSSRSSVNQQYRPHTERMGPSSNMYVPAAALVPGAAAMMSSSINHPAASASEMMAGSRGSIFTPLSLTEQRSLYDFSRGSLFTPQLIVVPPSREITVNPSSNRRRQHGGEGGSSSANTVMSSLPELMASSGITQNNPDVQARAQPNTPCYYWEGDVNIAPSLPHIPLSSPVERDHVAIQHGKGREVAHPDPAAAAAAIPAAHIMNIIPPGSRQEHRPVTSADWHQPLKEGSSFQGWAAPEESETPLEATLRAQEHSSSSRRQQGSTSALCSAPVHQTAWQVVAQQSADPPAATRQYIQGHSGSTSCVDRAPAAATSNTSGHAAGRSSRVMDAAHEDAHLAPRPYMRKGASSFSSTTSHAIRPLTREQVMAVRMQHRGSGVIQESSKQNGWVDNARSYNARQSSPIKQQPSQRHMLPVETRQRPSTTSTALLPVETRQRPSTTSTALLPHQTKGCHPSPETVMPAAAISAAGYHHESATTIIRQASSYHNSAFLSIPATAPVKV